MLATGGHLNLYHTPSIQKMISFPLQWEVWASPDGTQKYYPLFADNENPTTEKTGIWKILSRRFLLPKKVLTQIQTPDSTDPNQTYASTASIVTTRVRGGDPTSDDLLLNPPRINVFEGEVPKPNPNRTYYPSIGALISKTKGGLTLASKGGNNNEEHNHNQIGGYTVFDGPTPVTGSMGAIKYTPDTVGVKRYLFNINNSNGNPVPVVDGQLQNNLRRAHGKVLATEFNDKVDSITYDLKSAYNVEGLQTLTRKISVWKTGYPRVEITDAFEASRPISFDTATITELPTTTNPSGEIIITGGTKTPIRYRIAPKNPENINTTTEYFHERSKPTKRFGYSLKTPSKKGEITYTIEKL
jgi:hypothetical protein